MTVSSEKPPCFLGKGQAHVDIQLIRLANNLGHQRAIAIGLVIASSFEDIGAVVVMDADGEDRPEDVPRLLNAWGEEPNLIVVAQRSERLRHDPVSLAPHSDIGRERHGVAGSAKRPSRIDRLTQARAN
jgi:glycosyltransferase involved in cell wall biosynthesis